MGKNLTDVNFLILYQFMNEVEVHVITNRLAMACPGPVIINNNNNNMIVGLPVTSFVAMEAKQT